MLFSDNRWLFPLIIVPVRLFWYFDDVIKSELFFPALSGALLMPAAIKKILPVISALLVFCLLTVSNQPQWSVGLQTTSPGHANTLLSHAIGGEQASVFTLDSRTGPSSLHGLFKDAWISGPVPLYFYRECSLFSKEFSASFAHRADRSICPIRAPPKPSQSHS